MSGSSTLRLVCLAGMAPALTEAASSTRLKLQEPANKHCGDSVPAKIDQGVRVSRYRSPDSGEEKSLSKAETDIFYPKRSIGATNDCLAHLAISNRKQGDQGRWPPPTIGKGSKGVGSALTPSSPTISKTSTPINITRLGDLNLKGNQINSLVNFEDHNSTKQSRGFSKDSSLPKPDIIDNLKRMNHPQFISEKGNSGIVGINCQVNTDPKTSKSKSTSTFEKNSVAEHPGMVNGASNLSRGKKEEELSVNCKARRAVPNKRNNIGVTLFSDKVQSERKPGVVQATFNDKMGMCVNNTIVPSQVETFLKAMEGGKEFIKPCDDIRKECVKKQVLLERKVDTLLRRLKRMKGKVVESHTKEQLVRYVNFQHHNLQMVAKAIKSEAPCAAELKEHFLSNDEVKNMSTAQLVKLVRGCQSTKPSVSTSEAASSRIKVLSSNASIMSPSVASHCSNTSEKLNSKVLMVEADLDSDATASSSGGESGDEEGSLSHRDITLPSLYKRAEWKWAVDRAAIVSRWTWLQAQVSDLEYKIRQQSQVHRQLRNSKGGVVLGDPPSPGDILRRMQGLQLKQGAASLNDVKAAGDEPASSEVSPCNVSAVLSNVDKQASRLTQSLHCLSPASSTLGSPAGSKISSPLVNGTSDSPSSSTTTDAETAENSPILSSSVSLSNFRQPAPEQVLPPAADASCQASRCRPLRSYRKRKILRTIGLYKTSVKAARLSDIRCRCSPPNSPCPICGGRYNNTLAIDPDGMSFNERVALLDPSFHSVLSFPEDVQLSVHCEGLLKSGLWQTKPPPKRSKVGDYRRQKVLSIATEPVRKNGNKVSNNAKNNNTTSVINFSTKIKNKYDGKAKGKNSIAKPSSLKPKVNKVKRKAAKLAREALKRKQEEEQEDELEELYLEQDIETPSGSRDPLSHSGSHSSLKDLRDVHASGQRKRKVDHSYDINNIVIPHSIAASTRVEQIQYKEIVTPKWREVDNVIMDMGSLENVVSKQLGKTNGVSLEVEQQVKRSLDEDEEIEDLSDDKFAARHTKPEQEEKKRFRNFLQYPPARRNRARSDAQISSSGKDPLLAKAECLEGNDGNEAAATGSEEKSTDSFPQANMLNKSLPSYLFANFDESSAESSLSVRRRTISSCRRERAGSSYEDIHPPLLEIHNIEPWPRRTFPLSEEEFQQIQSDAPPNCEPVHRRVTRRLAEPSGKVYVGCALDQIEEGSMSRVESRAASPLPSNESVSSSLGDDPNDPEWLATSEISRKVKGRKNAADDGDPDWTGSDAPKKSKKR